jgi:CRP-like cAMP-binding protein
LSPAGGDQKLFENAGPGAILGLSETMAGGQYKLTARTASQARISFIAREQLLELLHSVPFACMQAVQLLSEDLHTLYHAIRDGVYTARRGNSGSGAGRAVK